MTFAKTFLTTGLLLALAAPVLAQNRDSDGDVISVIYLPTKPVPGGGYIFYTMKNNIPVQFTLDSTTVAEGGAGLPQQVAVDGTTYQVEQLGNDIYLRAEGSNRRILASAVPTAPGKRVNPRAFGLD